MATIRFSTVIKQFEKQGEKTGWTYIDIPEKMAQQLKPGTKKTFRIKGKLDDYSFRGIALIPMGGGDFIMALNEEIRKRIGKRKGAKVLATLEADDEFVIQPQADFLECLEDEPKAVAFFNSLAKSHQSYFVKWIDSAKTEGTKIKRIAQSVSALSRNMGYGEMIRALKKEKDELS
jgi:Domain of unknown function (DUF1905)/Bacteriocin-protection, YdeI or OmpD-Associated